MCIRDRRKGFESVRKGYRSADARLIFFENGLLYCKLTAASGIQKGLLLVSFVAVGNYCRGALKNSFSLSVSFAWVEKVCLFRKPKVFFRTNLSFLQSKVTLFHPPPPISTTLNLLFAKNTAVLLLFALILCCKAGASHRFKSLPAIPGEVAAFRKTGYLMNAGHFRKNHVSTGDLNRPRSPEVRKPLVYFWFFSYTRKVRKTSLSQEAPRFCKPRISAQKYIFAQAN